MNQDINTRQHPGGISSEASLLDAGLRDHMLSVYRMMGIGMLVTAITAWLVSALSVRTTPEGQMMLTEFGRIIFDTPLKWVVAFAPLLLLLIAIPMMGRLSAAALRTGFYAIAAIFGVSMSAILLMFTGVSIAMTFLATAAGFAGLSLWGYTTRKNLGPLGAFLIVGLVGMIVVMIANVFIKSSGVSFAISALGILIFAGLTASDTQRAKVSYLSSRSMDSDTLGKMAVMSALSLYLDFINLFQILLDFMGVRRE